MFYNIFILIILFIISFGIVSLFSPKLSTSDLKYLSILLILLGNTITQFNGTDSWLFFIEITLIFSGIIHAIIYFKRVYKNKNM
jgi:hypothetical protein